MKKKEYHRTIADDIFGFSNRKKGLNSKKKGARGELLACKLFAEWTGTEFNRVPRSGGLRWADSSQIAGDIVCSSAFVFPFVVEVKNYENLNIKQGSVGRKAEIFKFWNQACRDAIRVNKIPLLIVKDNTTEFVLIFSKTFKVNILEELFAIEKDYTKLVAYKFSDITAKYSFKEWLIHIG